MITLSCDPSLTAFGWSIFSEHGVLMALDCIQTKPNHKLAKTEDLIARTHYIVQELVQLIEDYKIENVEFEIPMGSKSSTAARALALVEGALISMCVSLKLYYTTISAGNVKKALTEKRDASKDEILAVSSQVPGFLELTKGFNKIRREAVADAVGVHLSIKQGKI
jgi:Holliday junction resolvasome RuvABC endonuclease subunit